MDSKLTIKLNKDVIESAKNYASSQKRSLSRIIESYLKSLTSQSDIAKNVDEIQISPYVKSMSTGIHIPVDIDAKKEYTDYLTVKYK
jgi:hypothetical protein